MAKLNTRSVSPFNDTSVLVSGSDTIRFLVEYYRFINDKRFDDYLKKNKLDGKKYESTTEGQGVKQRNINWGSTLSGSKAKKVEENPIGLLLYYLGIFNDEILNKGLRFIPNLNTLAEYGNFREEEILAFFEAGVTTLNDRYNLGAPRINWYELFNNKTTSYQQSMFATVFKDLYLRAYKKTMYVDNELKTINVDGLAFNKKAELEYVVEVKTKGLETTAMSVTANHIHQALFYRNLLKPKRGVIFLFSRGDRSYDFFVLSNDTLDDFDEKNKVSHNEKVFLSIYTLVLNYIIDEEKLEEEDTRIHTVEVIKKFRKDKREQFGEKFEEKTDGITEQTIDWYIKSLVRKGHKDSLIEVMYELSKNPKFGGVLLDYINLQKLKEVIAMIEKSIISNLGIETVTTGLQELSNKERGVM